MLTSERKEGTYKKVYLVKISGSMGCIYDFNNVHIYNDNDMIVKSKSLGALSYAIEYAYYDKRIHFHKWYVLDEKGKFLFWVFSPTKKKPFLSEWSEIEEGM